MTDRWVVGLAAALAVALGGVAVRAEQFPVVQTETGFLDACERDWVAREPTAAAWARDACADKWRWAADAGPVAEALLGLAPAASGPAGDAAQVVAAAGLPADVEVTLAPQAARFARVQPGAEGHLNLTGALRSRGVTLQPLGCPQYPGASMGTEKVMLVTAPGRQPFVLAVYMRPAPAAFSPSVFEADADFSGAVPDMAALRAGRYPGGGGRAFATEPTGWVADCPDPE